MKIEITNGYVILKPFASRKLAREFNKKIFEGQAVIEGEQPKMLYSALEDAGDILVLNLIEEIWINDEKIEVTMEVVETLSNEDFSAIFQECQAMVKITKTEKKTS